MWNLSASFCCLFLLVHYLGGMELYQEPLSMMRDGRFMIFGYLLFALLSAMGVQLLRLIIKVEDYSDVWVVALAVLLLIVVMFTPSMDEFHGLASFVLLGLLYFYYTAKLLLAMSPWALAHLFMPFFIISYIGPVYGACQKTLILMFVLELNIHYFGLSSRTVQHRGRYRYTESKETRAKIRV